MTPVYGVCCGHPADAHEHYRPGRECSFCSCPRFRRRRWGLIRPGGRLWSLGFLGGLARQIR